MERAVGRDKSTRQTCEGETHVTTLLIIGVILTLILGLPAILWLTKLIWRPKPQEEAIHRGIAETRQREVKRRETMPLSRG